MNWLLIMSCRITLSAIRDRRGCPPSAWLSSNPLRLWSVHTSEPYARNEGNRRSPATIRPDRVGAAWLGAGGDGSEFRRSRAERIGWCGRSRVRFPSSPMLWGCGAVVAQPLRMLFGFCCRHQRHLSRGWMCWMGTSWWYVMLLCLESAKRWLDIGWWQELEPLLKFFFALVFPRFLLLNVSPYFLSISINGN